MMKHQIAISTYHEYIQEGIFSLRHGLSLIKYAKNLADDTGSDSSGILGEINCRYAFLMFANSLESAANSLILSLDKDKAFYEEIEKLNTLLKYQIFCELLGQKIDKGNVIYGHIKDVISCRNEFVHPKPKSVDIEVEELNNQVSFNIKKTKLRQYPHYFSEIKSNHALMTLEDTLTFISWICFDICKFSITEGCLKIGLNSYGSNSDIDFIESDNNLKFDKRSFGRTDPIWHNS